MIYGWVAQLVEQVTEDHRVSGSIPFLAIGPLAFQLYGDIKQHKDTI